MLSGVLLETSGSQYQSLTTPCAPPNFTSIRFPTSCPPPRQSTAACLPRGQGFHAVDAGEHFDLLQEVVRQKAYRSKSLQLDEVRGGGSALRTIMWDHHVVGSHDSTPAPYMVFGYIYIYKVLQMNSRLGVASSCLRRR